MQCNLQPLEQYVLESVINKIMALGHIDEESEDQIPDNNVDQEVHVDNNGE